MVSLFPEYSGLIKGIKRFIEDLFSLKYIKLCMEYNHNYIKLKLKRYKQMLKCILKKERKYTRMFIVVVLEEWGLWPHLFP